MQFSKNGVLNFDLSLDIEFQTRGTMWSSYCSSRRNVDVCKSWMVLTRGYYDHGSNKPTELVASLVLGQFCVQRKTWFSSQILQKTTQKTKSVLLCSNKSQRREYVGVLELRRIWNSFVDCICNSIPFHLDQMNKLNPLIVRNELCTTPRILNC